MGCLSMGSLYQAPSRAPKAYLYRHGLFCCRACSRDAAGCLNPLETAPMFFGEKILEFSVGHFVHQLKGYTRSPSEL